MITYRTNTKVTIRAQGFNPTPDNGFPWPPSTELQWLVSLGAEGPQRKADLRIVPKARKVRSVLNPLEEERSALETQAVQDKNRRVHSLN